MTLDQMILAAIAQAERVLVGQPGASILPTFVIEGADDRVAIIATPWRNEADKDLTEAALRAALRAARIQRYCFMAEAWMAEAPKDLTEAELASKRFTAEEMPSARPDRIEVVMISASDATSVETALLRIVRGEAGTVLRLERDNEPLKSLSGRFADLLKPDPDED